MVGICWWWEFDGGGGGCLMVGICWWCVFDGGYLLLVGVVPWWLWLWVVSLW